MMGAQTTIVGPPTLVPPEVPAWGAEVSYDVDEVLPKLDACLGEGGFVPACDHGIPPDVPFDNFRYFRELVREAGLRQ